MTSVNRPMGMKLLPLALLVLPNIHCNREEVRGQERTRSGSASG
ncbi:hypothetical protein [Haematobacter missouriensis]|nr:hypothetical protein [Haematobacter missouriensis]